MSFSRQTIRPDALRVNANLFQTDLSRWVLLAVIVALIAAFFIFDLQQLFNAGNTQGAASGYRQLIAATTLFWRLRSMR